MSKMAVTLTAFAAAAFAAAPAVAQQAGMMAARQAAYAAATAQPQPAVSAAATTYQAASTAAVSAAATTAVYQPAASAAVTTAVTAQPAPTAAAAAATTAVYQTPAARAAAAAATTAFCPNPYGNLHEVNQGALRYQWTRDGITVDFKDRYGSWTLQEALQVRDALDKLPDLYIRKAQAGGFAQLYRDGRFPWAPWQFVAPPSDPLHCVTVPAAPWCYIACGDNLFKEDDFLVYRVITHELGHANQWAISGWATIVTGTPGFTSISWTTGIPSIGLKTWNGFVTDYARTAHMEDFAETAKFYWINPDALARVNYAKFCFMRDVVFEGLVSPPEARSDRQGAIDPVGPEITSLGDASDDWSSLVQVHGNHFMAAYDGGFNKVKYRGREATHLPISRRTIYSFVPWIDAGSAPITVTTQDGTSAPADFTVEKPWWKLW